MINSPSVDSVKSQLKDIRKIDNTVTALLEQRQTVRDRLTGIPSGLKDRVKSGGDSSPMEQGVIRLMELEKTIDRYIDREVDLKQRYLELIDRLPDREKRVLLIERYFNGKSWQEIAGIIGCYIRTVYRIHGEALSELTEIVKNL